MNNKKLERAAQVITALLFVLSVTMFVMCFVVQPTVWNPTVEEIEIVQDTAVSPVEAVEPEIDILVDTDESVDMVALQSVVESVGATIEKSIETVEEPVGDIVEIDPQELEMLAAVIYQEAGSNECCDECRRMVADVVLNRMADDRFPDTILEVLTQERQYGRYHWTGVVWPERASLESEASAVERAYRIAEEVLRGEHSDLYGQGYIWQAEFIQGEDIVSCDCGGSWIYFGR